ncbi:hypothetical protein [Halorubrum salsamenti]|uniref:hypothetical protein n=1 Tax=Halorubrum salsamenti TaxID=2583990 RepID=UPI001642D8AA|nr:hypothetical protein [Halorubrum salsamenti]
MTADDAEIVLRGDAETTAQLRDDLTEIVGVRDDVIREERPGGRLAGILTRVRGAVA